MSEMGRLIRENYLQQSPYSTGDAYCTLGKQYRMLRTFLNIDKTALKELDEGLGIAQIFNEERMILLRDLKNMTEDKIREWRY